MRTFYINNGNENGGPFTIEELKNQEINKTTLVWYEGMDEWKYAIEIVELKPFFTLVPPPIKRTQPEESVVKPRSNKIWGLKKSHFLLAVMFSIILVVIITLNVIQNNKQNELEQKNRQTELNNEKVKQLQKSSNEQRIQEEIQNKIESDNRNNRKKDSINSRLSEIKDSLVINNNNLAKAKNEFIDVQRFKLLRSETAKEEQIISAQKDINFFKNEIDRLQSESDRLYLLLETVH